MADQLQRVGVNTVHRVSGAVPIPVARNTLHSDRLETSVSSLNILVLNLLRHEIFQSLVQVLGGDQELRAVSTIRSAVDRMLHSAQRQLGRSEHRRTPVGGGRRVDTTNRSHATRLVTDQSLQAKEVLARVARTVPEQGAVE